jgi:hypothetical protein
MTSCCIPQLSFSFYRHQPIRADFSGGQISSDAGLLPLRAFDQRYGLTHGLAERLCDPREEERVRHSVLSLFRQRLYQIIRSSLAMRTPTTRIGFATIRFFRFLPINRWVNLSDHNQRSAAGRTRPRLAISSSCRMLCSIGL